MVYLKCGEGYAGSRARLNVYCTDSRPNDNETRNHCFEVIVDRHVVTRLSREECSLVSRDFRSTPKIPYCAHEIVISMHHTGDLDATLRCAYLHLRVRVGVMNPFTLRDENT